MAVSAAAFAILLAGCSAGSSSESTESGTSSGQTGSDAQDAGVLKVALGRELPILDPYLSVANKDLEFYFAFYDRLIHVSPDYDLVPGLAESWEFAEDMSYLELKLREGVTFHDGVPFNAEAVKKNYERAVSEGTGSIVTDLADVTGVEVVDEHTVRFVTAVPVSNLPAILSDRAGIQPSPEMSKGSDLVAGSGMYEIDRYEPGVGLYLKPYAGYWDKEAQGLAGLEFSFLTDSSAIFSALQSGQLNAAPIDIPQAEQARSVGLQIDDRPTVGVTIISLNSDREGLADPRLRRAINIGIDRQALVDKLALGAGEPTCQWFPEGMAEHDPDMGLAPCDYDPEEARRLVEEAAPDGWTLTLSHMSDDFANTQFAQAVVEMWKEVGIDAQLNPVESSVAIGLLNDTKEITALGAPFAGRPSALQTIAHFTIDGGFGVLGGAHLSEEREELYAKARAAADPAEQADYVQQISHEMIENAAVPIPVYFERAPLAFTEKVHGLEKYVSNKQEFRGVTVDAGN
ncbi:ABC transporter substrate-binding protein [Georgenia yuyongxinii]|uniref:ABC transporter substrate-binding protein n=1 Tax=Georgenia yuyongxinii TaxID=2589797 RepID=UPI00163D8396|nr:ABC transporter substrate-binding protein [Georgenia yuyongxinii]